MVFSEVAGFGRGLQGRVPGGVEARGRSPGRGVGPVATVCPLFCEQPDPAVARAARFPADFFFGGSLGLRAIEP
eukprot:11190992-Lingulodinium_polyedra.AAC.1